MNGYDDSIEGDKQEWRPERAADYADGPVLTDRQAETIATLDATDSRESTAALLGITGSTVDDHRQDGQARAVAAIHQLRQLVGESETIRQAVTNAFGSAEILTNSNGSTPFPNLATEELLEGATSPEPKIPDSQHITLSGPVRQQRNRHRWKVAFAKEYGDAEQVEMIDAMTGERVDVGSLVSRFPATLDTEIIPVAELRDAEILDRFLSDLLFAVPEEKPYEFRRINEDSGDENN